MNNVPFYVDETSAVQDFVSFRLVDRIYAIPLEGVVQIIPMVALTPLPFASPAVEGVMNFHGRAVPIINMRRYFGLQEQPLGLHTPIVLVYVGEHMLGLIVDDVRDVVHLPEAQIAKMREMMPNGLGDTPILQGLIHTVSGAILLLNLDVLFAADQARVEQSLALTEDALFEDIPLPELDDKPEPELELAF